MSMRDYHVVNFIPDNHERTATINDYEGEFVQVPVSFIPRVGDHVSLYSHRDSNGRYLNQGAQVDAAMQFREVGRGFVTRVEHEIEEKGRSPEEHHWVHHVHVFYDKQEV